jgi:quinoprotein glucose dehydrogenase
MITRAVFLICIHLLFVLPLTNAQNSDNWACYGNDPGGSRFSSLDQVNTRNVGQLRVAWTFQTGELATYEGTYAKSKAAFEATPVMIDHTLYFSTPSDRVFALDALNGKKVWLYDPKVDLHEDYSEITSRGVSVWRPSAADGKDKDMIVFIATIDGRLIALSAKNGLPVLTFGNQGTVDLKTGLGQDISVTSAPAIIGHLIVVGSSLGDNNRFDATSGTVRAYDVESGKLVWSWDPIPKNEADPAWKTWIGPKAHQTGAANTWATISVDEKNGLVFIPTSCPSPDYYGGERVGQNLYGNSLVALQASTGKMIWYFQVVHHDLWDYDIAAQPVLTTIYKDGIKTPVVIIGTKMGFIFVLDRMTGKPVFPVEERPVPASAIKGEQTWPTQPFPLFPAALGIQKIDSSDGWGPSESDRTESTKRIASYQNKGIYTPPSYQGSLMTPGNLGGIHWGGMCYDSARGLLITNINRLPAIISLVPREEMSETEIKKERQRIEIGRQAGTPYLLKRDYLLKISDDGFGMQSPPPWGELIAIDLNTGKNKWEIPLGSMYDLTKYPEAKNLGSLNLGGAIVTAGKLVFVAASMDNHLRAFNSETGELLSEFMLPASGQATPMTYLVNGKQFVVIAAGGHGKIHTKQGDFLVAYSLGN